ncbi:PREDICTED: BAG family molecular chaperone regulator 7 [Nicotiana attenuata]|uniref:Bag family molecular chaperone regulator 7 n=1 Tax=Nicotiana attenuata TaxID=49451 RepID=A0A314KP08_NICAT|nr:PREDICTED: BAG family molecular chaperone regulator 7 [Nicotiana attenuata]OIT31043.1 bag family molecular chaperone regulator 7 [Nicotiana attenuata]
MSRFRRFNLIEYSPSPSFFLKESSFLSPKTLLLNPSFHIEDELDSTLDLLCPTPTTLLDLTSPVDDFDTITDLIQIERTAFYTSTRRVHRRVGLGTELQSLSDRVSELERLFIEEKKEKKKKSKKVGERKYTWTAEIKSPEKDGVDRKYKWIAEVKDGKKKGALDKSYKFTAEIKGKNEDSRTYTFKASNAGGDDSESEKKEKKDNKKKKCEKSEGSARIVEIEEPSDHGALVLRQVFAKRVEKRRGKRKEISPQDAALSIQMSFRAYLIRRSQALRALRELAISKTKLKELRALFNNFTYRRRVARDAEERQRFSEKIIVLLLTVDAIEGADIMVRSAKKSMVDELEAMLDVIDPQPGGRPISVARRRTFDMPDGAIQKELAAGVAQVVQMLDESNAAESFEACL